MAEGTKITPARAAAYAAFACAASFLAVTALGLVWYASSRGESGVEGGDRGLGWIFLTALFAVLGVAPLSFVWLNSRVQRPDAKPGRIRFLSALPFWLLAWCGALLGILMFFAALDDLGGGGSGTLGMSAFIFMLAAWPLVVAMALAALISCAGISRPMGSNTLILATLAFLFGVASFFVFPPWPLLGCVGALAAWWWAVGLELGRLDAAAAADG